MPSLNRIFVTRPAQACGIQLAQRSNGGSYSRSPPVIEGPIPEWAKAVMTRWMTETVDPPAARLMLLHDATVRGAGVITLPGDIVVGESLINSAHDAAVADLRRAGRGRFYPMPDYVDGIQAAPGRTVLLKQLWDLNYGHWLVEGLPRMALLAGEIDLATCRFIVSDPGAGPSTKMRGVMTDTLALFGIRPDQLIYRGGRPERHTELIYPLPLTVHPIVKAPLVVQVLEHLVPQLRRDVGPAKLFVRRPPSSRRALRNQDDVGALLTRRGYVTVAPAELDFAGQVRAFLDARQIVGTLGAECTNLAFAPPGVSFLGLAPEGMMDDFFYDLVSLKHGRYFCLHGPTDTGKPEMNAAFSIDLTRFEAMLDRLESRPIGC